MTVLKKSVKKLLVRVPAKTVEVPKILRKKVVAPSSPKGRRLARSEVARERAAVRTKADPHAADPIQPRILHKPLGTITGGKVSGRPEVVSVRYVKKPKHPAFKAMVVCDGLHNTTSFLVNNKLGKVVEMRTVNHDGQIIGWETCGRCIQHIRNCTCIAMTMPAYVQRSVQVT